MQKEIKVKSGDLIYVEEIQKHTYGFVLHKITKEEDYSKDCFIQKHGSFYMLVIGIIDKTGEMKLLVDNETYFYSISNLIQGIKSFNPKSPFKFTIYPSKDKSNTKEI